MKNQYDDLRAVIMDEVFVRASPQIKIIRNEHGEFAPSLYDFRAILLQPTWLNRYAEIFWEKYASHYPFQVCAMETAGISLVAAVVMKSVERGTPVNGFFIRKSRKRQGLMKAVEGVVTDAPIIMLDDLINSGSTVEKMLKVLYPVHTEKKEFFALLAFREKRAYEHLMSQGVEITTLFTLEDFGQPLLSSHTPEISNNQFDTVWKFAAPDPSFHLVVQKSTPAIDTDHVYFGTDAGVFYALNQSDGAVAWKFAVGKHPRGKGILSSPALHRGTVYFGAYDGNVYALDAATGEKKWVYAEADWIGSSPAIASDLHMLFVGLEFGYWRKRGGIAAINLSSGKELWKDTTPSLTHGSPLYIPEESMVVIGSNDGVLYAYDAQTGSRRWQYQTEGDIKTAPAYDKKRRIVVCTSMDGNVYAVGARDGIPLFAYATNGGMYSTPLVHGDTVYVTSLDKTLYAIDLETGKERAQFETNGRIFASPTIINGSLWIGSNDARLYELDPERLQLKSSTAFSERIVNKIVYNPDSESFFIPTVANELYCAKKKVAPPVAERLVAD